MSKQKRERYIRHITVSIDDVFSFFRSRTSSMPKPTFGGQWPVKVGGLRFRTFATKGVTCKGCGLTATHFAIEKHKDDNEVKNYHLNLWASVDGKEILFTHDHQIARGLGGSDTLDNSEPMCESCNTRKSKGENSICNQLRAGRITKERAIEMAMDLANKKWTY